MPFPFTFSLNVPGISNPFSAQGQKSIVQSEPDLPRVGTLQVQHERPRPLRRPSPTPPIISPVVPLSRKRGWEPSVSGPSLAAASSTSSIGYLDTPAKYREMASGPGLNHNRSRDEIDREIEDIAAGEPSIIDRVCNARCTCFLRVHLVHAINSQSCPFSYPLFIYVPHSLHPP